jgi:hypothetical protein
MIKTTTVKSHAAKLRRICDQASYASMVPNSLPNDPVLVGDLSEFVFIQIGAWSEADRLVCSLRSWIDQGGHK